ncbi:hypothetical protein F4820DRAFT_167759 [Hypoxylon rubiginosum]|uniref:Uncharacterized protein n=1 Tax=Hypoxylon rubiginosum TaxID=110542 RepID=A0ACB9YJ60_9PEZI|nr:hypothetical protein F4820DRAFT_167759 [Hypoxylon rubiginosum]
MATVPAANAGPKKLSFAKVVASNPKENIPIVSATRVAVPTMDHPQRVQSSAAPVKTAAETKEVSAGTPKVGAKPPSVPTENGAPAALPLRINNTKTTEDGKDLHISSSGASTTTTPSLVVNGSSSSIGESHSKNDNATSVSDDASQRADSNSELGTKAPSLDGKSITSGTTFALDEKESLRPDDSASVKASAEDDEAFSVRGSLIANSRFGSEGPRIHRLRLGDMPERRIVQILPESQDQGVATPQSGASSQPPPVEQPQALGIVNGSSDVFTSVYGKNPDEKLLEAMQSPKDRIFLLRLEQDVINFVLSSKEPYMDLPPNNSFCRMLTHKLADYYQMTHSFEAVQGSVRIYRTPFCRVPASLASMAGINPNTTTASTPPVVLPKKIMRRGEEDGSGQGSTSPSKATSEIGSDGKEKAPTKEKLTREEREEAYQKARERIFGNSEKPGESTPDNDDANGVSRASSVSAKDKSNLSKRGKTGKQRRDDSESFDSRSQYQPYYNPHQPNWTPQYIPIGHTQYGTPVQQPYQSPIPQTYVPPAPAYPPMMPSNAFPQYGSMPVYPPPTQPTPPRYPPANGAMNAYGGGPTNGPVQTPPHQAWQPGFTQAPAAPFQARAPQPPAQGGTGPLGIPYAFGQLPVNANPHDPKSQHPIPGSYNRHAFNPKTQSFVPSNSMMQVQPPIPPYTIGTHGSPQLGSPHAAYSGYSSPAQPQAYVGGPGYGMSRSGSNNSLPAYHAPQHLPQHPSAHLPQVPPQMHNVQVPQMPQKPNIPPPTGPGQTFTHLPTYGNPATLPQKPPSGI